MDSMIVQYIGFVVAALIIIWAVIEINRRYFSRRNMDTHPRNTWVPLDTNRPDAPEKSQPIADADAAESGEQDLQTRARQNGHYSESKRAF